MTESRARGVALVDDRIPRDWLDLSGLEEEVVVGITRLDALDPARVRGLLCTLEVRVDRALLDRLPNLRIVSNAAVGVDNVDVEACRARGIRVGNTPGVLTAATADLTWALILAHGRRVCEAWTDAREGRWTGWSFTGWLGRDLAGATLGVVGAGAIGSAVARRGHAFGMNVLYAGPSSKPELEADLHARHCSLDELLARSDVVTLHCPARPETRGLISARALALMRPDALLVNVARGSVVDQTALVDALERGALGGAALDVTDPEPLPADHPLFRAPRCLVLPHVGSATAGTRRAMAKMAAENLIRGLRALPLVASVA